MRWFWLLILWIAVIAAAAHFSFQLAYVLVAVTLALLVWSAMLRATERQVRKR